MTHYALNNHPEYNKKLHRWREATDHYSGDYATDKIQSYLFKKEQRETPGAFSERQKVTDPILHFSTAIDGLCGIMFSKAKDTKREWGELGDPNEPGTIANRIFNNADGEGTDWPTVMKQAAVKLSVTHTIWGLVDGIGLTDEGQKEGDGTIHIIDPQSVVNWYPSTGKLEEVLVKEQFDTRTSIGDSFPIDDTYILYTLDGWRRYNLIEEKDENDNIIYRENTIDEGGYDFYRTNERTDRILPIFRTEIPMPRDVGFLLSRKENAIFNMTSVRDFAVRILSFALLRLTADDENEYDLVLQKLMAGTSVIGQFGDSSVGHDFISPDSSWLTEAGEILDQKVKDFYINAFKEYGDAAAQRTATEVRLESQTGIEAFLTLLVGAVDEFENNCSWRMEQVYNPDKPGTWGQAKVQRSTDFTPRDEQEAIDKMVERYFSDSRVPAPMSILVGVVQRVLDMDNFEQLKESEQEELKNAIRSYLALQMSDKAQHLARWDLASAEQILKLLYPDADKTWISGELTKMRDQTEPVLEEEMGG